MTGHQQHAALPALAAGSTGCQTAADSSCPLSSLGRAGQCHPQHGSGLPPAGTAKDARTVAGLCAWLAAAAAQAARSAISSIAACGADVLHCVRNPKTYLARPDDMIILQRHQGGDAAGPHSCGRRARPAASSSRQHGTAASRSPRAPLQHADPADGAALPSGGQTPAAHLSDGPPEVGLAFSMEHEDQRQPSRNGDRSRRSHWHQRRLQVHRCEAVLTNSAFAWFCVRVVQLLIDELVHGIYKLKYIQPPVYTLQDAISPMPGRASAAVFAVDGAAATPATTSAATTPVTNAAAAADSSTSAPAAAAATSAGSPAIVAAAAADDLRDKCVMCPVT